MAGRIIAFRNILIHGYADVDSRLVWDIVETKLAVLSREIESLLEQNRAGASRVAVQLRPLDTNTRFIE